MYSYIKASHAVESFSLLKLIVGGDGEHTIGVN